MNKFPWYINCWNAASRLEEKETKESKSIVERIKELINNLLK